MKLCFFIDDITHTGGIERVISLLCGRFAKNNPEIEIEIVSQFRSCKILCYDFANVHITYLSEKDYDAKPHSLQRMFRILGNVLNVRKHFKDHKYDVIVGQSYPNNILLYLAGVGLSNVIAAEHVYYDYYGGLLKKLRLYIYKKCRKVVVLTSKDKECYDKYYPSTHTVVIPNPVELTKVFESPLNNNIAISVGRIQYQKGFDTLVEVFKKVHDTHPEWVVHIYGDGNMRFEIEQLIEKAGLAGVIILKGLSTDIYAKLRDASFYIMSSRYEGFPMVLIEAQSQGLPVVSFDCPNGPSDIIKDGINGILVEDQNKEKLYEGICYMIEHPLERKRMGKKSLDNVNQYSTEVVCSLWLELFK